MATLSNVPTAASRTEPVVRIEGLQTTFGKGSEAYTVHQDLSLTVQRGEILALVGCHWGLRVEPNTQSLGAGTTASVVTSITMVIVVDALFAIVFKNVGI